MNSDRVGDCRKNGAILSLPIRLLAVCLLLFLSACGSVPVAQDISQSQSREIVAVLTRYGITAEAVKETGGAGKYRVEVRKSDYQQAVLVMQEKGLPAEIPPSFEEMISSRGLLPGSRELESLKADRAVAAEIEQSIEKLSGVKSSRVIVRRNSAGAGSGQAGVSVVIGEKEGESVKEAEVRKIVSQAVPGIPEDRISLILHKAATSGEAVSSAEGILNQGGLKVRRVPLAEFVFGWKVADEDYVGLVGLFIFFIVAAFGSGAGLAWFVMRMPARSGKLKFQAPQQESFVESRVQPPPPPRVKSLID